MMNDQLKTKAELIQELDSLRKIISEEDQSENKRLEDTLRESEERFKALHDASFGGVIIHDKGLILDCNQGLSDITGFTNEELIGMDGLKLIAPDWLDLVLRNIKSGHDKRYEVEGIRKDGSIYPLSIKGKNVGYKGREVRVIEFWDITERKQAEQALQEIEAKQSAMISNISDVIGIIGADGLMKYKSPNIQKWFGWQPQDLIGNDGFSNVHPDDLERIQKIFSTLLEKENSSITVELRYKGKDGSFKPIELTATNLLNDPNIRGVLLNYHDITQRTQAEEALYESEKQFKLVMRQSPNVFELYDLDGLQIEVNEAYEKLWGFPASQTVNKFNVLKSKEVVDTGLITSIQKAYSGESVDVGEYQFDPTGATEADGPGRVRWLKTIIYPLKDSQDMVKNIVITHEDVTERKLAENRLRESNARHSGMIENIGDVIAIVGADGMTKYQSPNIEKRFGWRPEDLIDTNGWDKMHPDDVERIQKEFSKMLEKETASIVEYRFKCKDGIYKWIELTAVNRINDPAINGVLLNYHDISERKTAEEELHQSQEHLSESSRLAKVGGWEIDFSGNTLRWTTETFRIHEVPEDKVPNVAESIKYYHPDDQKMVSDIVQQATEKGANFDFEARLITAKNNLKWVRAIGTVSSIDGVNTGLHGMIQDITERKQAEEELIDTKDLLNETGKIGRIGGWKLDFGTGLSTWTEETYNLFEVKYDREAPRLPEGVNFYTPEYRPIISEAVDRAKIFGEPYDLQLEIITSKNNRKWVQTIGKADRKNGTVVSISGTIQDITERKLAEEEILKLNNELEERVEQRTSELLTANEILEQQAHDLEEVNRLKSAFLSNMSHELRTPLNSVISLSGVLDKRLATLIPDEDHSYLRVIERNGQHLLELINGILDLSRIESGKEELQVTDFHISTVITEIIESVEPLAAEKGIELIDEVKNNIAPIHSDAKKCQHILLNLIANAVKFTAKGQVIVSTRQTKEDLFISVTDTGIGISDEQLPHIFDAFRQANETTTRDFEGTGLGLAIAIEYTRLLSGELTVKSVLGEGSVFTLRLPLVLKVARQELFVDTAKPELKPHQKSKPKKHATKPLVLIVDDNADNRFATQAMLKSSYEIIEAQDGLESLQMARDNSPDVILMDALMPVMDGKQALQELRKDETLRHIPVIVVTASAMYGDKEKLLDFGFDAYVSKPIDSDLLIQAIESAQG